MRAAASYRAARRNEHRGSVWPAPPRRVVAWVAKPSVVKLVPRTEANPLGFVIKPRKQPKSYRGALGKREMARRVRQNETQWRATLTTTGVDDHAADAFLHMLQGAVVGGNVARSATP